MITSYLAENDDYEVSSVENPERGNWQKHVIKSLKNQKNSVYLKSSC